jgi:hypothetical protein
MPAARHPSAPKRPLAKNAEFASSYPPSPNSTLHWPSGNFKRHKCFLPTGPSIAGDEQRRCTASRSQQSRGIGGPRAKPEASARAPQLLALPPTARIDGGKRGGRGRGGWKASEEAAFVSVGPRVCVLLPRLGCGGAVLPLWHPLLLSISPPTQTMPRNTATLC